MHRVSTKVVDHETECARACVTSVEACEVTHCRSTNARLTMLPSTKEYVSSEHVTPHEALFKMHNYWRYQIFELVGHETECAAPCVTLIATIVVTSSRASLCSLQATHRQQPLRNGEFMPCQKLPMSGMHFLQLKEI